MESMYIAQNKSIKVPISLYTKDQRAEEKALLDSGATECFISLAQVEKHNLSLSTLSKPWKVQNVDEISNQHGKITHTTKIIV